MTFDKNLSLFFLWITVLLTANACGDLDDKGSPGLDSEDTASTNDSDPVWGSDSEYVEINASCDDVITGNTIWLTDATNYSFSSHIEVQDITVKSAANLTFDWGNVTTDIFDNPINPSIDIDMVLVTLWGMTADELKENIRVDNLPFDANKGAILIHPVDTDPTSQQLFNFTSPNSTPLTQEELMGYFDTTAPGYAFPQSTHTFMLIAASGETIGKNNRMFGFFHLDPLAPETTVALNNNSMTLDFKTNLSEIMPVPIPAGTGALTASWEYMGTNALGNKFIPTQITEVMIGHYTNLTRPQMDAQFLHLREIADSTWSAEVPLGYSIDLSTLLNDVTGAPFTGVDNTGVWILALFCTMNCNNPAPWSITILQAC